MFELNFVMRCSSWTPLPLWLDIVNPWLLFHKYLQFEDGSFNFVFYCWSVVVLLFMLCSWKRWCQLTIKETAPKWPILCFLWSLRGSLCYAVWNPSTAHLTCPWGPVIRCRNGPRWGPTWGNHAVDFSSAGAPRDGCCLLCWVALKQFQIRQ